MRSYTIASVAVFITLAGYMVGALKDPLFHIPERYPFFSWFVFSRVPQPMQVSFDIRVREYKGTKFDPPISLSKIPESQTLGVINTPEYLRQAHLLGVAIVMGREREADIIRRSIENMFFPPGSRYELIRVTSDLISQFRTGDGQKVEVLGEFTAGENL